MGTVEACRDSRGGMDIVPASEKRMETTKQLERFSYDLEKRFR